MSYEVFRKLCDDADVTPNTVAKATGIDPATFSAWKAGRYTPKTEKRLKVARYFGVTLEYLDTGEEATRNVAAEIEHAVDEDPQIKELFSLAKKATPEQRAQAVRIFHALIGDTNGSGDN